MHTVGRNPRAIVYIQLLLLWHSISAVVKVRPRRLSWLAIVGLRCAMRFIVFGGASVSPILSAQKRGKQVNGASIERICKNAPLVTAPLTDMASSAPWSTSDISCMAMMHLWDANRAMSTVCESPHLDQAFGKRCTAIKRSGSDR